MLFDRNRPWLYPLDLLAVAVLFAFVMSMLAVLFVLCIIEPMIGALILSFVSLVYIIVRSFPTEEGES